MDASTRKLLSCGAAEAIGLGMICFFGCMGTLNGPLGITVPHLQVALTFGLAVMVAIACFAHISGAHFNPAVTLLSLIMRLIDIKTALVYFVSQCIGGALGYGLLKVLTPTSLLYWGRAVGANATLVGPGPCCTVPHGGLSPAQAVLGELLGTAALLMLCCAVWDPRNAANTDGIPIKFGLLIAGVAMCLGPYTGASLNPARSLAPALWEGTWTHHWVYWVGPLSAAVLLGYGWPMLFGHVEEPAVKDKADVPLTLVSADGKRHSRLADDDDAKLGY
ncbi:Aquaporin-4 [Frankliniella fusca]|uniref:Aquaporin-4 n=1 Tax=Frankliniella fusca TaxID=407009 RepID=A0AAE1LNP6_9NEOP|nr:Aquaporin-4 [Frankliniella fusca]